MDSSRGARWLSLASGLGVAALCGLFFFSFDAPWALRGENKISLFPMYADAWRQWSSGHVPLWTSGMFGGFPLLAGMQSSALYPPHALAFALTPSPHWRAMDVSLALHAGLLAAGCVRLLLHLKVRPAGALLGGALACMAPQVVYWTNFVPSFAAVAWWPWLFLAADRLGERERAARGSLFLGAVALAAQVFVGYLEFAVYSGCFAAIWILADPHGASWRLRSARVLGLAASAALLAAPQLLPTALALQSGAREALALDPLAQQWAGIAALFDPRQGTNGRGLTSTFLGGATLILAACAIWLRARASVRLAVIAGIAALLAFGEATPLYEGLSTLPPFSLFRAPVKFYVATNLCIALLAGLGFEAWLARGSRRGAIAGFALGALALGEYAAHLSFELPVVASRHIRSELKLPQDATRFETLLPILLPANPDEPPPRLLNVGWPGGFGSLGEVYGVESILGHPPALMSLLNARQAQLLQRSAYEGFRWIDRSWLDRFGVQLVSVQGRCSRFAGRGLETLQREPGLCLLRNPSLPPRFELLDRVNLVADEDTELERIQAQPSGATPVVAGHGYDAASWMRPGNTATVESLSYRPGALQLKITTPAPRFLLVREARSEGWSARIDGNTTPILPAAGLFFAVPIPAGVHEVEVRYRARGLGTGLALASAWLAGMAALAWRDRGRRR